MPTPPTAAIRLLDGASLRTAQAQRRGVRKVAGVLGPRRDGDAEVRADEDYARARRGGAQTQSHLFPPVDPNSIRAHGSSNRLLPGHSHASTSRKSQKRGQPGRLRRTLCCGVGAAVCGSATTHQGDRTFGREQHAFVLDTEHERNAKELLYRCMEELQATKAALYLEGPEGDFNLATSYGFWAAGQRFLSR